MDAMIDLLGSSTGEETLGFVSVLALKGFVLLLALILLFGFLRKSAPSFTQFLLRLGFLSLLVLPFASLVMPDLEWRVLPATPTDRFEGGEGLSSAEGLAEEGISGIEVATVSAASESGIGPMSVGAASIISLVWILGSLVLVSRTGIGQMLAHRMIARATPLADKGWISELARYKRELGIRGKIRLLQSSEIEVPIAAGLFRPAILVPAGAVQWSGRRRRAVVIHELAHIKHRDLCFQLIAGLTCALHWFNPLAWVAERLLRLESERSCDSEVIASGFKPSEYARHLLAIAHEFKIERLAGGTIAMVKRSQLNSRILSILGNSSINRGVSTLELAGLVALMTCFVAILAGLVLTSVSATPVPQKAETTAERRAPAPPEQPAPPVAPEPPPAPSFSVLPAPPSPPSPPSPPEPPAPASLGRWEEGRSLRWRDEEGELSIDTEGVVLSEDGSSIASIETSGYLSLERRRGERIERIELRPGPSGAIQRSYSVDGATLPWNEEAGDLEARAVRALREIQRAREEMERVRTVELPRVREELQRIKEIDFDRFADQVAQAQKAVLLARKELSQLKEEKALGLKGEELQKLQERLQKQEQELAGVESEALKRAAEQLRKLKEELPKKLESELQKLDELQLQLEEQKDLDP